MIVSSPLIKVPYHQISIPPKSSNKKFQISKFTITKS